MAEPEVAERGPAETGAAEPEIAERGPAETGAAETAVAGASETAVAEPEVAGTAETEAAGTEAAGPGSDSTAAGTADQDVCDARGREPMLLPACFGVLAVILGGLAVWFGLKAGGPASGVSAFDGTNMAVTDAAATAEVNQQIDSAVDTIFSYDYADTAKTAQAARNLLTGRASQEYATLFRVVQAEAPKEKLVLTTTVTNSGVETLTGNSARLLIFANQQDTAATSHSTTDAGAMFAVTAVRQGGRWKIEDIDTFSAAG